MSFEGLLGRVTELLEPAEGRHRTLFGFMRRADHQQDFYYPAHREAAWELISEWRARCWRWGQRVPRVCLEAERIREENADDSRRWSNLHGLDKLNYRHERLSKAPASAAEDRPALRSEVVELLARLYQWRSDADRAHRAQENLRVVFYSSLVGLSEPNTLNFAERLMTGGGPV